MSVADSIRRFLADEISTGKLLELISCPHDLVGGFAQIIQSEREALLLEQAGREQDQWEKALLVAAIRETLNENKGLADGENCTLIRLKHALRDVGDRWE